MTSPGLRDVPSTLVSAALVAVLVGLTGGCSSDADQPRAGASHSPSTAPTPSASPSRDAEAPPAAPPYARTDRGAEAFARHVMDLWGYGLRTDDAHPLTALSPGGKAACGGCRVFAATLAKRHRQGWTVDFPGLDVRSVKVRSQGQLRVATATVDVPESDSYDDDGSYRNTSPAHRGATFVVRMRAEPHRYRLLSFTLS